MILTVTMNPSIDTAYPLAGTLKVDDVNRVELIKTAGGKGLNVTRVLGHLDDDVVATNLLGDRMGDFIADRMDEDGVSHDFVRIFGENRVCIAALHEGNQTEFFEAGPAVLASEEFSHIQSGDNRQSRSADSGQCAGSRLPNLCSGYTPLGCIPLTFVACGTASTE